MMTLSHSKPSVAVNRWAACISDRAVWYAETQWWNDVQERVRSHYATHATL